MSTQIGLKIFKVRILMMEQNVHARTLGWGIQHYNQHEQNEGYHLITHGNEEEVMRQNSNVFPLPEEGN